MTDRHQWKLGASTCIFEVQDGMNEQGFLHYQESGISYAELSRNYEDLVKDGFFENPQRIRQLAGQHGVTFWSFHVPFGPELHPANLEEEKNQKAMEIMQECIRRATEIGIKTIVVHPSSEPNKEEERAAKMERAIQNLKILSDLCQSLGAVLAVEDLPRTCLGNHSDDIIAFLDAIPELMLCFDTNHLTRQANGEFLEQLIKHKLHGRIRTIHASDYDAIDERHRLPLDGVNNWGMIFQKLEELDYQGVFMYEVSKGWDRDVPYTLKDIAENFESLKEKYF